MDGVVAGLTYTAIAGQGAYCDGQPLARVNETRGWREVVIITDIKEIVALPRLTRCLVESRGHRRSVPDLCRKRRDIYSPGRHAFGCALPR